MTGSRSSPCSCRLHASPIRLKPSSGHGPDRYPPAAVDAFQAIVLGIVQGLTEFLPISSTGHLLIVPAFLGWEDPGAAFTAVTQLGHDGRGAPVLPQRPVEHRADVVPAACASRSCAGSWTRGWAGTSASARSRSAIFGLVFSDQIESGARSLYLIGTTLIVLGLLLLVAEKVAKREREIADINGARRRADRLRAGAGADPGRLALGRDDHRRPVLGLRPRVRRPLLVPALGSRGRAVRPVRGCARSATRAARAFVPTALATLAAFIVGYASIAWLLRWLTTHSTMVFVVYRVALGALVIALTATGVIAS